MASRDKLRLPDAGAALHMVLPTLRLDFNVFVLAYDRAGIWVSSSTPA